MLSTGRYLREDVASTDEARRGGGAGCSLSTLSFVVAPEAFYFSGD
jgi:hypothetical protein